MERKDIINLLEKNIPSHELDIMDNNDRYVKMSDVIKVVVGEFSTHDENVDVCPVCGYPTFKKSFENFKRCEGCDWTSLLILS